MLSQFFLYMIGILYETRKIYGRFYGKFTEDSSGIIYRGLCGKFIILYIRILYGIYIMYCIYMIGILY